MLVCSGTMPTFEPLTTKQTNLALCSTIQTGFIDRRITATRSNSGSSRAGDQCCGGGPGHQRASSKGWHHPGPPAPRLPAWPLPPESPRALLGKAQRKEWVMVPASPFNSAIPGATALLLFKAGAAEPSPSVWVLLSFRCPQGSSSARKIQGPFRGKEGWFWLLLPSGPE